MEPIPFFEDDYLRHDLRRGTLFNRSGTKMCYMPSEMVTALVTVLREETGDSWTAVMRRVGRLWGRRVAKRNAREFSDFYQRPLHDLPAKELAVLVEGFFRYSGWGLLTLDFSHARHGFITARLDNSAFVEVVGASDAPVDSIVAGLLAEFFAQVSERPDLDCIETECASMGAPACRFIVGIAARINPAERMRAARSTHDEIISELCPEENVETRDEFDTQPLDSRTMGRVGPSGGR